MNINKEFTGLTIRDTLLMIGMQVIGNQLPKEFGLFVLIDNSYWQFVAMGFLYALMFRFFDWKEVGDKKGLGLIGGRLKITF